VLTGADVTAAGFKSLPNIVAYPGKGGQQMKKPHHPVLALERVRYVGEPVAMIVADTAAAAEDARELIDVEYRDLPATASFDAAVAPGAPQLHADVPGNLAFEYESGDEQAVAAAFARASTSASSPWTASASPATPWSRAPAWWRTTLPAIATRFTRRCRRRRHGGADLGGLRRRQEQDRDGDAGRRRQLRRARPGLHEYFAAMLAARKLGRPVKWVGSRSEVFVSDFHGRAISLTGELALDADGRFLAIRFDDRCDLGAYGAAFGAFIATRNITITMGASTGTCAVRPHAARLYQHRADIRLPRRRTPRHRLCHRAAGGLRGPRARLRPDRAAAQEHYSARRHAVQDAERRGLRFRDFEAVMDDAMKRADWVGFPQRRAAAERARKLRGIGIATYLEAGGGGPRPRTRSPSSSTPTAP